MTSGVPYRDAIENYEAVTATDGRLNGFFNSIIRHIDGPRGRNGNAQARVLLRVWLTTGLYRHGDFASHLGKYLSALRVLRTFAVHDVLEFTVACHGSELSVTMSLYMGHFLSPMHRRGQLMPWYRCLKRAIKKAAP